MDSTIVARSTGGFGCTTIRSELSNEFVVTGVIEESILIADIILSVNCWAACWNFYLKYLMFSK